WKIAEEMDVNTCSSTRLVSLNALAKISGITPDTTIGVEKINDSELEGKGGNSKLNHKLPPSLICPRNDQEHSRKRNQCSNQNEQNMLPGKWNPKSPEHNISLQSRSR
ncbi:hypothetical protein BgiBS90_018569, partial [Biomphalaria glabrata]